MISVVIPTLNAERGLPHTLSALVPAALDGVVRQVVIVDGGSQDDTVMIADGAGADIVHSAPGRGEQMAAGARIARSPWLLFLHADTVLSDGWVEDARKFVDNIELGKRPVSAAAFRFAIDDEGFLPRLLEAGVRTRCSVFRLPYGDQGLLISRSLYDQVGGYRHMPLMEDVDLIWRLGRRRIRFLRSRAVTSAARYKRDGYVARSIRNLACLTLYSVGLPMNIVVRLYQGKSGH